MLPVVCMNIIVLIYPWTQQSNKQVTSTFVLTVQLCYMFRLSRSHHQAIQFDISWLYIVACILVTRQVIKEFRIRWSDLFDFHQAELQLLVTQSYTT
jgi:hypothetical protein